MIPQCAAVRHLVQFRDARAVCIRHNFLCPDVHCDFTEVQVRTDARRRRDARRLQHVPHDRLGKLFGGTFPRLYIVRRVDEYLVDGIDVHILRCNIFEVHLIDARTHLHIVRHPRRRNEVIDGERFVRFEFGSETGFTRQFAVRRASLPLPVDLAHLLHDLEQARPAGNTICFERGRNGEANRLFRTALIRHDEVGRQWIESSVDTLDGRIE